MTRHVAFLRGLNVGGHRVKMDRLRSLFTALGFTDVATFIASGNVIFSTAADDLPALEGKIAAQLRDALGYDVDTFIRTMETVADVASSEPFPPKSKAAALANRHVFFLHEPASATVAAALHDLATPTDAFVAIGTEVHWATAGGVTESPVEAKHLANALGRAANTSRNARTLRRLIAKFGE